MGYGNFGAKRGGKKGPRQVNGHRTYKVRMAPAPAVDHSASASAAAGTSKDEGPRRKKQKTSASSGNVKKVAVESEDEEDPFGYQATLLGEQKPMDGMVITFTGASDSRAKLADLVKDLGGKVEGSLCSNTTHLIAETLGSAKYEVALKQGMKVMKASWIAAVRDLWVQAKEIDMQQLEYDHKLPPFHGLTIVVTGFTDLPARKAFREMLCANGANVPGKWELETTHLILATGMTPAALAASEKVTYALSDKASPDLKVVWEGWVDEALARGGVIGSRTDHWSYTPGAPEPAPTVVQQPAPVASTSRQSVAPEARQPISAANLDEEYVFFQANKKRAKVSGELSAVMADLPGAGEEGDRHASSRRVSKSPSFYPELAAAVGGGNGEGSSVLGGPPVAAPVADPVKTYDEAKRRVVPLVRKASIIKAVDNSRAGSMVIQPKQVKEWRPPLQKKVEKQ